MQFRLFGIPVYVSTAFWMTAVFFGLLAAQSDGTLKGTLMVAAVVILFLAVLVHELGHALVARAFGARPTILLHGFGGSTSFQHRLSRGRSMLVTAAGPFAGFVAGAICLVVSWLVPVTGIFWPRVLDSAIYCTFGWGVINLLPVLPLDGGALLRDALGPRYGRATLIVSAVCGLTAAGWFAMPERRNLFGVLIFGLSAVQSARAAWSYREIRAEETARTEGARRELEAAAVALERGALTDAETRASAVLGLTPEIDVRDQARRILAGAALERGDGPRALTHLAAIEVPTADDDVRRAQGLDAIGERDAAFLLLDRRAAADPSGPALEALLRGLCAIGQTARAAEVGRAFALRGAVSALRWLAQELLERGEPAQAGALATALFDRTGDADLAYDAALARARVGDAEGSLQMLESAVLAGFHDGGRLAGDGALDALRSDPRFVRLLARVSPSLAGEPMAALRRHLESVLARPALVGVVYVAAFVGITARRAASDARVLGVDATDVASAISAHFGDHIHRAGLLLGALAIATGILVGACAGALVRIRDSLRGRDASAFSVAVRSLPVVAALHALAILLAMARRPQLYEDAFYAQGGLRRLVQIAATDVLRPGGVVVFALCAAAAYLAPGRRDFALAPARLAALARASRVSIAVVLTVALVVLLAPWLTSPPARTASPDPRRPNVLLLAADSLRADRIVPETAPRLADLRARSVSFERAYVSLPRTFPSWVTMLTGVYPHHHGIRNMFPSRKLRARDFEALPARLAASGYATAVVSDYAGDIFPRVALGFEDADTPTFDFGELITQRALEAQIGLLPFLDHRLGRGMVPSLLGMNTAPDARGVARRTLDAIDRSGTRPFFVVGFFSTTHFPYASPSPGYRRFADGAYRGRYKYEKVNRLGQEAPPDDADVRQIRALYDGAVSEVDAATGEVLDGLRARGLDDSTIVIVTADHGETLFENGRGHGHGDHLFGEEALRVPLLIHDGRAPRHAEVRTITRDVDLAPTIDELTHVTTPPARDGTSFAAALTGATLEDRTAFAETGLWFTEEVAGVPAELRLPYPDISRMAEVQRDAGDDVVLGDEHVPLTTMAKHRAITTSTRRLVLMPTREGLRSMLFDLGADPGCTRDLSSLEPAAVVDLRSRLLGWVLEDRSMELRGPHLMPRAGAVSTPPASAAIRLEKR